MNAAVTAASLGPGHCFFVRDVGRRRVERLHQRKVEDLHLRRGTGAGSGDYAVAARGEVDKAGGDAYPRADRLRRG